MKLLLKLFSLFIILSTHAYSQDKGFTLSGSVSGRNGEHTGRVTITVSGKKYINASHFSTDTSGAYSIAGLTDSVELHFSLIGYKTRIMRILMNGNRYVPLQLEPEIKELREVQVTGSGNDEQLRKPVSVETLKASQVKEMPVIAGEADVLKSLQLRPGIKQGAEGSSSLLVRGGGADQNLILLDGATIYNPNHLFGYLGIFNNDAIREATVYKGGFPASYGGRLSSVADIKTINGNPDSMRIAGGIGILSSRISAEGPLPGHKLSYAVSARRSYFDIFTRQYNKFQESKPLFEPLPLYYLYDVNLKLNYRYDSKNSLQVSAYQGADNYTAVKSFRNIDFYWSNRALSLKYLHTFSDKLLWGISLHHSSYRNSISTGDFETRLELNTSIGDYTLKTDINYHTPWLNLQSGVFLTLNTYEITKLNDKAASSGNGLLAGEDLRSMYGGMYVQDETSFGTKLNINAGLRISFMNRNTTFYSLEPRYTASYLIRKDLSLRAGYSRMSQHIHLISNPAASLPTDIWYPSGDRIKPQYADQVNAGAVKVFKHTGWSITGELYYKWLHNQVEFRDGAQIIVSKNYSEEFVFGDGYSYGSEICIEKKTGRLTGWLGYTLSQNWRTFPEINNGKPYHPNFDRRHDLTLVLFYRLSSRLKISATWTYATGNYVSVPIARYLYLDVSSVNYPQSVPIYSDRNSYKLNDYHRMDLSVVWDLKPRKGESDLTLSIYNVYDRENPYFLYFKEVRDAQNNILYFKAKQVSLFPILPSLTYNFRF